MTPDMLITEWVRKRLDLGFDIAHRDIRELLSRLDTLERERDEWKREAELSKWPKDAAKEHFEMKVRLRAAEEAVEKTKRELWVHDPPVSLPMAQTTGWNNALVAFERRLTAALAGVQAPAEEGAP